MRPAKHITPICFPANTKATLPTGYSEVYFCPQLVAQERRLSTSASRTMAAISLGFIVMVTPWTIQEVVAACTATKVRERLLLVTQENIFDLESGSQVADRPLHVNLLVPESFFFNFSTPVYKM